MQFELLHLSFLCSSLKIVVCYFVLLRLVIGCLSFELRLQIVCPSIYGCWFSVLRSTAADCLVLRSTADDCLSFDLRLLIVCPSIYGCWLSVLRSMAIDCLSLDLQLPIVYPSIYGYWLSVLRSTAADCLSFDLWLPIVCPSIYGCWFHFWCLQTFLETNIFTDYYKQTFSSWLEITISTMCYFDQM